MDAAELRAAAESWKGSRQHGRAGLRMSTMTDERMEDFCVYIHQRVSSWELQRAILPHHWSSFLRNVAQHTESAIKGQIRYGCSPII
jgi:hypothetical protein